MRLMINLASRYDAGSVQLKDVAGDEGVSLKYMGQIVVPLRARRLLLANRGAKGGYRLSRPPAEITAREVFEALDGPIGVVDCVTAQEVCARSVQCVARRLWSRVSKAVAGTLAAATLKDLAFERSRLSKPRRT